MGTRSLISKETGYKTEVESKYCHWDGYPSHNGVLLDENYNTEDDIDNLLSEEGYISSLGDSIKNTKFNDKDITDFHADEQTLLEDGNSMGVEYIYLFKNGEWYVSCTHSECPDVPYKKFILLSNVLKTL